MPVSEKHQNGTAPSGRLWSVESLRLYAVLGVVIGHSLAAAKHAAGINGGLDFSRAGLDIFFIISGLLVWRLTRTRETHPALFFVHRVSRLAPLYWIFTATYLAFINLAGRSFAYEAAQPTLPEVFRSLIFIPFFNAHHDILPVLEPGWTLPFDVWYFAIFSFILMFPKRTQLLVATISYVLIPLLHGLRFGGAVAQVITHPRSLDFLAGIWIAHSLQHRRLVPRSSAQILTVLSLSAILTFIALGIPARGVGFVFWAIAACVATYAMVSIEGQGGAWKALFQAPVIGVSSYSIYLLQPMTITASCMLMPGGFWPKFIVAVSTSLALGVGAHFAIEQPINKLLKRMETNRGFRPQADVTVAP